MKPTTLSSLANTAISVCASVAETPFRAGEPFGVAVVLTNEGDQPIQWSERNRLNLSYRWLGENDALIERNGRRTI